MTGAGMAFYASGLIYSSVVRATLLFYLTPVWATLIGMIWLGERATWVRWVAIAMGLLGLLMLVSGGSGSVPLNIGDFFALLSGIFWAIGAALIMRFKGVPLPGMVMVQFAVTAGLAVLVSAFVIGAPKPELDALSNALPFSVVVSLLAFLPAVGTIFWAQKFLFPGRAGLLMMSEVLVAVISASLFIPEEAMSAVEWAGAVLIICACLVEVLGTPKETASA